MKKTITSIVFIGLFSVYALYQHIAPSAQVVATTSSLPVTQVLPEKVAVVPITKKVVAASGYRDGTYTGTAENAYYGNVQVQAIISNGKITDVSFLDYPQEQGTSRRINSSAMSQLKQEAITAQSARVSGVSGASDTSAAFKLSLASALSQARA